MSETSRPQALVGSKVEQRLAGDLAASRASYGRAVNVIRAVVATNFIGVFTWVGSADPGGPWAIRSLVLVPYLLLATAAAVLAFRFDRVAEKSGLLIPTLDVGLAAALLIAVPEGPFPFALSATVLMLLSSKLWGSYWLLGATAGAAVVLQLVSPATPGTKLGGAIILLAAAALGVLAIRNLARLKAQAFYELERELLALEQRDRARSNLSRIVESLPHAVVVHRDRQPLSANAAARNLLGSGESTPARLEPVSPLGEPADAWLNDPGRTHEASFRRPDGRWVPVEVANVRLEFEDGPAVLSLLRDLTERKNLEDQALLSDRLATLGTLAASVAHEINSPLTVIQCAAEFLAPRAGSIGDRESEEVIGDLAAAAGQLRTIVQDLRVLSRRESDEQRPVDLASVVERSLRLVMPQLRGRAAVVKEERPAPLVLASETRLSQVLTNLLVNAAHAVSEVSGREQKVTVRLGSTADGKALLEVEDTGTGMPPEVKARLFEPFFTTKPQGVGTGLGLSICKRIVAALDGYIEVESEPGKGSIFRVVLPPIPTEGEA